MDESKVNGYIDESSNGPFKMEKQVVVENPVVTTNESTISKSLQQLTGLSEDAIAEEITASEKDGETTSAEDRKKVLSELSAADESAENELYYKKLMVLLGKSTHYSEYLFARLLKFHDKKSSSSTAKSAATSGGNVGKNAKAKNSGSCKRVKKQSSLTVKNDCKENVISTNVSENSNNDVDGGKNHDDDDDSKEQYYVNESGLRVSVRQPKLLTGAVMRDYQLDGLEWMIALYENAVNGILADEMGLGKTIQIISLISYLFDKNVFGPFLVIAPLSTVSNWLLEFQKFAPKINVMIYHGNDAKRKQLKADFKKAFESKTNNKQLIPVVVTSYEIPLRDKRFFRGFCWRYVIVDEGHRLKNHNCLLSQELRTYRSANRLLLTGTPLQNNLTELWSLLNFILPKLFNDINMFDRLLETTSNLEKEENQNKLLVKEQEVQIVSKMHQILGPFLLRRMKSDVNIDLPKKKEMLVYTPLTTMQETLYKASLDYCVEKLTGVGKKAQETDVDESGGGGRKKRKCSSGRNYVRFFDKSSDEEEEEEELEEGLLEDGDRIVIDGDNSSDDYERTADKYRCSSKLSNMSMQLRKIVCHPYLVRMPIDRKSGDLLVNEDLIRSSGKFLVLDVLLPRLKRDGHKLLLFSTFTSVLDLLEEFMLLRDYTFVRLDGTHAIERRIEAIKRFNTDPDVFVFLISTRAGGLGINLTAADSVIIFDSDWNPQVDLQAQDRCHRLGQTRPVVVYRLVGAGTVDEKILERATGKRKLERVVVKDGTFKQVGKCEAISVSELKDLLQSTDYNRVFRSRTDSIFTDEDLEQILDRSDLTDDCISTNNNNNNNNNNNGNDDEEKGKVEKYDDDYSNTLSKNKVFKVLQNTFTVDIQSDATTDDATTNYSSPVLKR